MAMLKGKTWMGMPATDYLYMRLEGEDGEAPWTLAKAAKECSKKLRVPISEHVVSKWRKRIERDVKNAEQYELLVESTVNQLARHAESGLHLDELVDAQIVMMIAKVHSEEGIEDATKFIREMTALKRAITSDREQKQGVREYEESVATLKGRIELLIAELKAKGFDPAALDDLNRRTVAEIDEMVRKNNPTR
jgi:uncharacterized small protein (DUF1192 family)